MKLFVGLGNPGAKYVGNRHNIGFMAIDRIAADHGFGPFKTKFSSKITDGVIGGAKVILLKPETFMNRSGQAVGEALRYHKLAPEDVTVFHDELDLAPAKLRCKSGGGHAGHNGLRSIHDHIGANYNRVRMGIGHPGHKDKVASYVLRDFAKSDQLWLEDVLAGLSDGIPYLAAGDTGRFLNAVSLKTAPPRSSNSPKGAPPDHSQTTNRTPPHPPKAQGTYDAEKAKDQRSPMQKLLDRFNS